MNAGTAMVLKMMVSSRIKISQRSTVTATVIQVTATITPAGSTSICSGSSVVLNANTGGGLTYQWKLNGTNISGATASSYTASSAGNYTVVVSQNGCSMTSAAVTVTVTQVTATITPAGSTSICSGSSVILNANTGGGLSYQWKLNGNNISGATTSSYAASSAGDYTVVVSQSGCSVTSSAVTVTVTQVTATITPGGSTSICSGSSVVLNANNGGGLSYQWKLNGSNISGATTSSYTASSAGDYTVVVTQNGCSVTSSTVTVTVTQVTATITPGGGSTSICSGSSVVLNANTGGGLSYQWKLNGSNISGATTSSYTASSAGDYTVVVSQNGCSVTSSVVTVTVTQVTATITPGGSTSICSGSAVVLNANTGGGLSYQWKLNGSNISGATASSYIASSAGDYTVVVSQNGCSATSSAVTVTVTQVTATITPGGSTSICSGSSVVLNANTGGGLTYQWLLNAGVIVGATASSYTATQAGDYTVDVTSNGCRITSSPVTVSIISAPSVSITSPGTTICKGSSMTLTAAPSGLTYQWTKSGTNISGATDLSYSTTKAGNYACKVTYQCGTITSNAVILTLATSPTATITPSGAVTICSGSNITLQANTGNFSYQWKKGTADIAGASNSSLLVTAKGNYKVAITDNTSGCSKTSAATKVTVQACKLNSDGEDGLQQSLTIYPNPTSGDLTVSFNLSSSVDEEGIIIVKNLLGQTAYSSTVLFHSGDNEFLLNLGDLDSGIYLLELEVEGNMYLAKVIIGK